MKIEVKEFTGDLGWKGSEVTKVIDEERFKRLYGEYSLFDLISNGHTGDCIGQDRGMFAKVVEW